MGSYALQDRAETRDSEQLVQVELVQVVQVLLVLLHRTLVRGQW